MSAQQLRSKNDFDAALLESSPENPVIIACFNDSEPSKSLVPTFNSLSKDHNTARFYIIDVDTMPEAAEDLGVKSPPYFVLFKHGKKVAEVTNADARELEEAIVKYTT